MASIKKNFIWNSILQVSALVFPLIIYPYVSRIIGSEGIGKVSFATSVITYFSIIAQLGIPTYGIRSCAQVADDKAKLSQTSREIFIINIFTTIIAYVALVIAILVVPKFREEELLLIITSLTMGFTTIGMTWLYSGLEKYRYITLRSLAVRCASLLMVFAFVHKPEDYIIYGSISVIANAGSNIFNLIHSRKFISYKRFNKYNFRRHLKPILVFFSMSVAGTVYTSLDTIMLGFIKTNRDVGYYSSATKIRSVLLGLINALATVILPRASAYIQHHQRDKFVDVSRKALNFVAVAGTAVWIYFSIFAKESILVLSGKDFVNAVSPMLWIMPTVLICGVSNLTAIQMLVPLGMEKTVLYTQITGAAIDFVLNYLFIPRFASSAAAAATMIAEFIIMLLQVHALHKKGIYIKGKLTVYKILLATGVSCACTIWIKFVGLNALLSLIISVCIFFGVYIAILYALKEQIIRETVNDVLVKIRRK